MYAKGQGVTQDYTEALRWYRKAAAQGYAAAQNNLGFMYDNGRGVPQDYTEAVRWYSKAAAQGLAAAQSNLGFMYDNGQGVTQDYVQAHKWFNIAASRGNAKAAKGREIIAKRMTTAQIAEAQRLARAWRPKQQVASARPRPDRGSASAIPRPDPGSVNRQHIAAIQRRLASLGYDPGPADGVLGPRSHAAIHAFQAREGLPVTGVISDSFETALRSAVPP